MPPSLSISSPSSVSFRLHMLLLGIIICVIVYMYLVCRDVKRLETELRVLKSQHQSLQLAFAQQPQVQVLPPSSTPMTMPGTASAALLHVVLGAPDQDGRIVTDEDDDDNISEDLRDMLIRIEDEELNVGSPSCQGGICKLNNDVDADDDVDAGTEGDEKDDDVAEVADAVKTAEGVFDVPDEVPSGSDDYEAELRVKKLDELRRICRERSIDASGKKEALIARLVNDRA